MRETMHPDAATVGEWADWLRALVAIACLTGIAVFTWLNVR
jgi:hypothetical protein